MSKPILKIRDLAKTFRVGFWRKKVEAVREISFEVEDNEIFGIVGPNGAGKTTLMKMITALIFPDRGSIELFGQSVGRSATRRRLGYLPEEPYFYDHLSVVELLYYYGALHGMGRREVGEQIDPLLERVGLSDARERPLRKFSKGMRQRAGIAQALINDPDLVILDEPQSGLDPIGRKEVRDLIYRLREDGKTVIFSSHILVDVEAVCDRVAILNDGNLVDVAALEDLTAESAQRLEVVLVGADRRALPELPDLEHAAQRSGELVLTFDGDTDIDELVARLSDTDASIRSLSRRSRRLEDQFLQDTRTDANP